MFLADEISLADDSVLERLNSVLEPERLLVLAEKGVDEGDDHLLHAHDAFRWVLVGVGGCGRRGWVLRAGPTWKGAGGELDGIGVDDHISIKSITSFFFARQD